MSVRVAYTATPAEWAWADVRNIDRFSIDTNDLDNSVPEQLKTLYMRSFSVLFWWAVSCVLLNQSIFVLRLTLNGRAGYFLKKETLWAELCWAELIYWFNGPLFLPILMILFQALECYYPASWEEGPSTPLLRANPTITCW